MLLKGAIAIIYIQIMYTRTNLAVEIMLWTKKNKALWVIFLVYKITVEMHSNIIYENSLFISKER